MTEELKIYRRPCQDVGDNDRIAQFSNPTDDFIEVPLSNLKEDTEDTLPNDQEANNSTKAYFKEEIVSNNPTDDLVQETSYSATPDEQQTNNSTKAYFEYLKEEMASKNPTDGLVQETCYSAAPDEQVEGVNDDNNPGQSTADVVSSAEAVEGDDEKKDEGTDDGWKRKRGFRIFNDLKSDIWIRLKIKTSTWVMGVGAVALVVVTAGGGAVALATYGGAVAATEVTLGVTAAAAATSSSVATAAGLTAGGWTAVAAVSGTGAVALGIGAVTDAKGMKEMKARGEQFKDDADSKRISPGDYFEYQGYWNRNVQVMADGVIYQQTLKCEYGMEYRIGHDKKLKFMK